MTALSFSDANESLYFRESPLISTTLVLGVLRMYRIIKTQFRRALPLVLIFFAVLGGAPVAANAESAASTLLDNLAHIDAHVPLDVTRTFGDDDGLLSQIIVGASDVQIAGFGVWGSQLNDGNIKFAIFEAVFFEFEPGTILTSGVPVYISPAIAQVAATDQWFDSPALSLVLNANTTYYVGLISDQPFTFRYSANAPALTQNGLTSGQAGIAGANATMRTFTAPFFAGTGSGQPAIRIKAANTLIDNGDTTLDSASGLEWLDLTLTQGVSAQDVLAGFGGYVAAGWTFATVDQVCGLLGALGDDVTNCTAGAVGVQMDPANAATLVNLLGSTVATGSGAYGMFNNIAGFPGNFGLACINDTATSCTGGGSSSWLTLNAWASGYQTVGSFLIRPTADADGDGVPDASDQCPGTPAGTAVNSDGCPPATSLLIEAEDYTAYWDSDSGSNGAAGKPGDDVDIEATTDLGGGRNIGWAAAGEWLEYQVYLSAGDYAVDTRVASQVSTGAYDLLLDGMLFGSNTVPGTGGWQVWETQSVGSITVVTSGLHTLRVNVTGNDFNLNWIELTQAANSN